MIRRSALVYKPLRVCFPGGTIEPGERADQAVVREMWEELSAEVVPQEHVWTWESSEGPALTLYGWRAELRTAPGALRALASEVAEILWLTGSEALAHPDALPNNREFVAALEGAGEWLG